MLRKTTWQSERGRQASRTGDVMWMRRERANSKTAKLNHLVYLRVIIFRCLARIETNVQVILCLQTLNDGQRPALVYASTMQSGRTFIWTTYLGQTSWKMTLIGNWAHTSYQHVIHSAEYIHCLVHSCDICEKTPHLVGLAVPNAVRFLAVHIEGR